MYRVELVDDINPTRLYAAFMPSSLSISRVLDEAGTWSFVVPADTPTARELQHYGRAKIYRGHDLVLQGLIENYQETDDTGATFSVSGSDELGYLARMRAFRGGNFQHTHVAAIVYKLLKRAPNWELGDVSSLDDPELRTTLDLTGERTLLAQIRRLVSDVPGFHFRYGGINPHNGKHRLDIGFFSREIGLQCGFVPGFTRVEELPDNQAVIISPVTKSEEHGSLVRAIEAYGGEYTIVEKVTVGGEEKEIEHHFITTLGDALLFDATLASHPQYPIVNDGYGLVVVNSLVYPYGAEIVEVYGDIRPQAVDHDNDPNTDALITQTQINQAGFALYQKAVNELKRSETLNDEYSFSILSRQFPPLGDKSFVRSNKVLRIVDPLLGRVIEDPYEVVNDWLRIAAFDVDVVPGKETIAVRATTGEHIVSEHELVAFLDAITPKTQETTKKEVIPPAFSRYQIIDLAGDTGRYKYADVVTPDGREARAIVFAPGAMPGWATDIGLLGAPRVTPGDYEVYIAQYPTVGGLSLVVYVLHSDTWTTNDYAEVSVRLLVS